MIDFFGKQLSPAAKSEFIYWFLDGVQNYSSNMSNSPESGRVFSLFFRLFVCFSCELADTMWDFEVVKAVEVKITLLI